MSLLDVNTSTTNAGSKTVEKVNESFEVGADVEDEEVAAINETARDSDNEESDQTFLGIKKSEESLNDLERLQIQQELLENKVNELEEKLSALGLKKKLRDTYRLQISNAEQKQKMLAKRIAVEKARLVILNGSGAKETRKSLSKSNNRQLFYINSFTSGDVLERKTTHSPHRLFREEKSSESFRKRREIYPQTKDLENWGTWQRLDAGKDKDFIDGYNLIIPRTTKTTNNFFPPIPAPDAKKRPRDRKEAEKEPKLRLIPNSRRLASNRLYLYEKQLEFSMKYGLETKDILKSLEENEELLEKLSKVDYSSGEVTRQQLYLMGALSREFLNDDAVDNDVKAKNARFDAKTSMRLSPLLFFYGVNNKRSSV
ncbi:hypothetical protein AC249_AIPGENE6429 [Exaiptasia diaphana]|nr:hypothetical protein AC249_AIPGENE6429 [Exaiptasia diaphana]